MDELFMPSKLNINDTIAIGIGKKEVYRMVLSFLGIVGIFSILHVTTLLSLPAAVIAGMGCILLVFVVIRRVNNISIVDYTQQIVRYYYSQKKYRFKRIKEW